MTTTAERIVPNPLVRPTISVIEAGELLGLKKDAAYDAARRGEIPTIRLGRTVRVPTAKLLELLGISSTEAMKTQRPTKRLKKLAA